MNLLSIYKFTNNVLEKQAFSSNIFELYQFIIGEEGNNQHLNSMLRNTRFQTAKARRAHLENDKKAKDLAKKELIAATFSGVYEDNRKLTDTCLYSGYITIDIDKILPLDIDRYYDYFLSLDFIHLVFLTASGFGFKIIVKVDCEYQYYNKAISQVIERICENDLIEREKVDKNAMDATRISFINFEDEYVCYNRNSTIFHVDTTVPIATHSKNANSYIPTTIDLSTYNKEVEPKMWGVLMDKWNEAGGDVGYTDGNHMLPIGAWLGAVSYTYLRLDSYEFYKNVEYFYGNHIAKLPSHNHGCDTHFLKHSKYFFSNRDRIISETTDAVIMTASKNEAFATFEIQKWVSEISNELKALIKTGETLFLFAGTGTGKTNAILKIGEELNDEMFCSGCVLIEPLIELNKSIEKKSFRWASITSETTDKKEAFHEALQVCTLQQLLKTDVSNKIIFIDEAHNLINSLNRGLVRTVMSYLKNNNAKSIVYISATPPTLIEIPTSSKLIEIKREKNIRYNVNIKLSNDKKVLANEVETSLIANKDGIVILFINSMVTIREVIAFAVSRNLVTNEQINVVAAKGSMKQHGLMEYDVRKQILDTQMFSSNIRLVLVTSSSEFGLDFNNTNIKHFIFYRVASSQLIPEQIVQAVGRPRKVEELNVTILAGNIKLDNEGSYSFEDMYSNAKYKTSLVQKAIGNKVNTVSIPGVTPHMTYGRNSAVNLKLIKNTEQYALDTIGEYADVHKDYTTSINAEQLIEGLKRFMPNSNIYIDSNVTLEESFMKVDKKVSEEFIMEYINSYDDFHDAMKILYEYSIHRCEYIPKRENKIITHSTSETATMTIEFNKIYHHAMNCSFEQLWYRYIMLREKQVRDLDIKRVFNLCGFDREKYENWVRKLNYAIMWKFHDNKHANKAVMAGWEKILPTKKAFKDVIGKEMNIEPLYEAFYHDKHKNERLSLWHFERWLPFACNVDVRQELIKKEGNKKRTKVLYYIVNSKKTIEEMFALLLNVPSLFIEHLDNIKGTQIKETIESLYNEQSENELRECMEIKAFVKPMLYELAPIVNEPPYVEMLSNYCPF